MHLSKWPAWLPTPKKTTTGCNIYIFVNPHLSWRWKQQEVVTYFISHSRVGHVTKLKCTVGNWSEMPHCFHLETCGPNLEYAIKSCRVPVYFFVSWLFGTVMTTESASFDASFGIRADMQIILSVHKFVLISNCTHFIPWLFCFHPVDVHWVMF